MTCCSPWPWKASAPGVCSWSPYPSEARRSESRYDRNSQASLVRSPCRPFAAGDAAAEQRQRVQYPGTHRFQPAGLLPHNIETIEEQTERAYSQYNLCNTDLDRHIFLRSIQDNNETLFFRLLEEHLEEMMPIIYTPTVGQACQEFSKIYRTHRGLFISYPDRERIDDILRSATKNNVKIVVVTDSERILGLGDQGIGGMGIPIGKLSPPPAAVSARPTPCRWCWTWAPTTRTCSTTRCTWAGATSG